MPVLPNDKPKISAANPAKITDRASSLLRLFSWSDTPRGVLIDPIPNPKRYLVIGNLVSIELGKPGWSIGPQS